MSEFLVFWQENLLQISSGGELVAVIGCSETGDDLLFAAMIHEIKQLSLAPMNEVINIENSAGEMVGDAMQLSEVLEEFHQVIIM